MAPSTRTTTKDIAAALRARVLALRPSDLGLQNTAVQPVKIFGVVIETAHPDAVASLVVLADGSVSLYVSDGNGCIGCGGKREVRDVAAELLTLAQEALSLASTSDDDSLPAEGFVRFYFLTSHHRYSVETRLEHINLIDDRLGKLYFAGQRVLAAVERVGAGQSLAQEIRLAMNSIETGTEQVHEDLEQCLSVGNVVRRLRT